MDCVRSVTVRRLAQCIPLVWLLASGVASADAWFEAQFPPPQVAAVVPIPAEILADQSLIFVSEEHAKLIDQRRNLAALGPDLMGEQVNLQTGALSFVHTDIDLPGNSGLPVRLLRRFTVEPKRGNDNLRLAAFADWEMDVPYLSGTFAASTGWVVSAPGGHTMQRCAVPLAIQAVPPQVPPSDYHGDPTASFQAHEYWHGFQLHAPDDGGELLWVDPASTQPKPSTGGPYYWATNGRWFFSCAGNGEQFVGHAPDGLRYYFTHLVSRPTTPVIADRSPAELARVEVRLMLTRVEDRFDNAVTYTWVGDRLQSISATDGRAITLSYNNNGHVQSASDGVSSWIYDYTGSGSGPTSNHSLGSVALPDGSRWDLQLAALASARLLYERGDESPANCYGRGEPISGSYSGSLTHPSGATASFTVAPQMHGRTQVPRVCINEGPAGPTSDDYSWYTLSYDVLSLQQKTLTGAGLGSLQWTYRYHPSFCFVVDCGAAPDYSQTTIQGPDGEVLRYRFGTRFQGNEGKLLQVEQASGLLGDTLQGVLRTETSSYRLSEGGQAYPTPIGLSPQYRGDAFPAERYLPLESKVIAQDGATFSWQATTFDAYAFPLSVIRSSSLGHGKTELTSYAHHTGHWLLGQVLQIDVNGSEVARAVYDPVTAQMREVYHFGQRQQTLTYHPEGMAHTLTDAVDQTLILSNWQRGIPQQIDYPDGSTATAVVDSRGRITSRTDEEGHVHVYGYDPLGRLTSISYPSADTVAWSPTEIAYTRHTSADYGLSGLHWRRTESTGSRVHTTYYDARWHPLLERRVTLTAYPVGSVSDYLLVLQGVRTLYDVLGRVTETHTDSELGELTTQTDYLSPFRMRFTDADHYVTTTTYQAFDRPETDAPLQIDSPEGVTTTWARNLYGNPISLTRSGTWLNPDIQQNESLSQTRRFVYDAQQRLCKIIEPDAGVSIFQYDAKGRLNWHALGQNSLDSTSDCQQGNVPVGERTTQHYDARDRTLAIDYPSPTDDVGFTWAADGTQLTATVGQLSGTAPVSWASQHNQWTYSYNHRHLLESEALAVDGKSFAIDWTYNPHGDISHLRYPGGLSVAYTPNAYGEARQVGSYASNIHYHPSGHLAGLSYGHGGTRSVLLNARQLPERITDQHNSGVHLDHQLIYDARGNLSQQIDGVVGASESRQMGYDGLNRLTAVHATPSSGSSTESYAYDPLDRLRRTVQRGVDRRYDIESGTGRLSRIRTIGSPHDISFGWNTKGELSSRTRWRTSPGDGAPDRIFSNGFEETLISSTETFVFDHAHRLNSPLPSIQHRYDAHGHRVSTTEAMWGTRWQVYSRAGQLLSTEDSGNQTRIDYFHLNGQLIAERRLPMSGGGETLSYLHTDHRSSPSVKTSSTGIVIQRSIADAYGAPQDGIYREGPGFTGHDTDPDPQLIYMQQRYYDPVAMRFISPDPVPANALSFNRYWYANNNPITNVDPDGRDAGSFYTNARYQMAQPKLSPTEAKVAIAVQVAVFALPLAIDAAVTAWLGNAATANTIAATALEAGAGEALGTTSLVVATTVGAKAVGETFEIIDGVRRAKAADLVGNATIPGTVAGGGAQDIPVAALLSPNKSSIDVSTPVAMDRYMRVQEATQNGVVLPPIQVQPGSRGTPIKDVDFDLDPQ
ncbi:MAG: RHS repeat-associated core domain-containing protein [Rhodanobacteraceae bacterium]|nr:RHS repeat-associated core domain-containing protein [Rhodanobacteraceae bacterium]